MAARDRGCLYVAGRMGHNGADRSLGGNSMNLVPRVTGILTKPQPEWARIAAEPTTTGRLFTGYAVILAAAPLVVQIFVALVWAGVSGALAAAVAGVLSVALTLAIIFVLGMIANALAPSFGGARNDIGAMKLVVYAATPLWVVGILAALMGLIPLLGPVVGVLLQVLAFGYTTYLLYLGSPIVMGVSPQQALPYALIIAAIWLVIYLVIIAIVGAIVATIFGVAMIAGAASAYR